MTKISKKLRFLISIAVCQLAGLIGSVFTISSIPGWYAALQKPSFSPPNWVFAPVWVTLYFLMGVSLYLIWKSGLRKNRKAISAFAVQLLLNVIWSITFFGLHSLPFSFVIIIFLWFAIFLTIAKFHEIDKRAAYLLIPYILWVSFASVLNFYIWMLNI